MSDPGHLTPERSRRAALMLAAAGSLGGSVGPIAIGMGGLVGLSLLPAGEAGWATLPVTAFVVGSALASVPAALLMQRVGRRAGFVTGLLIGATGAAGAAAAVLMQSFALLLASFVAIGLSGAFVQQYRFAAADAAEPAFKARAISWVMAAGVISGIVGPQVSINGGAVLPSSPFAGTFILLVGLLLIAAVVMTRLDVPRPARSADGGSGRPLIEIIRQPAFLVALLSAVASFSLMSLVMTASPLAMVHHHHSTADSQIAIQWHVIAMFLPSFVTGNLIGRFGKGRVVIAGFVLIAAAAGVGLSGTGFVHFLVALVLLGVGWNFGFIGATAMLASLYRPEESFKVQAANEVILFGIVAIASFSSGGILAGAGWSAINLVVLPVVALCIGLIGWRGLVARRAAQP